MTDPSERWQAHVDGALPPEESAAVEAELAANPEARSYVDRQRALRARLQADFAPVLEAPIPSRLQAAFDRPMRAPTPRLTPWRAAAGGGWLLAAGLGLALLGQQGPQGLVNPRPDGLEAQGALAAALEQDLSGADPRRGQGGEARALASFQASDGRFCRLYEARSADQGHAGLACRERDGWRVVALVRSQGALSAADGFRTAGSGLPPLLLETADAMREGDALDAAQEQAARETGWR